MLNLGSSFVTFLGIALAIAGVGLYFLRSLRPELARDHDIFFAAISLVCGLILLFQGWRLDPILAFSQYLMAGSAIFFAFENIRLRGVTTEQARRNTPIVEDDRRVSRDYRYEQEAELEELEPEDDEWSALRRIPGSRESRSTRNGRYEQDERRRPSSRSTSAERSDRTGSTERRPKRRPRPESRSPEPTEEWGSTASIEDRPSRSSRNRTSRQESNQPEETEATVSSRPRRRPSGESNSRRYRDNAEAASTEYVDYQPIDTPDGEGDNSRNFDG